MKKKTSSQATAVIGIDLGTTNSTAAIYEADGKVKTLPDLDGNVLTPSVVCLADESNPVVGTAAVNQEAFQPAFTVRCIKRSMGKRDADGHPISAFVHEVSGRPYTAPEISSFILRHVAAGAQATLGGPIGGVVITVPAYYDDLARMATRQAGELADLNVLSVINEPTAAALAFGLDHGATGRYAVYDLGGGTFDVSILDIVGEEFRVLATDGDRDLGGSDIDNLILNEMVTRFEAAHHITISPDTDLPTWLELRTKSEQLKKTLSQAKVAKIMVSAGGQHLEFELTRAAFEKLIAPVVGRTREITERALVAAGVSVKEIDGVLLVGGSTRIPAVRAMLTDLFGTPPRTDTHPDEAVAMGAAIAASRYAADRQLPCVDSEHRPVLPPPTKLTDVNSHPLGCIALVDGQLLNCVIIPANTPLPAHQEELFSLEQDDQPEAEIHVAQGADRVSPEACTLIATARLHGLKPGPAKNRVRVRYGLSAEGVLEFSGTDVLTNCCVSDVKRIDGLVSPQSPS